tara:strand:+ start:95 stop:619 length:525 start_codon:yes stop_codon:yes gene_type:complete
MLLSENIYEPDYTLLKKNRNIEIRQYGEYIVAKTTVSLDNGIELENNMFRTLASYIFGRNQNSQNIPMTAPVTTFKDNDNYNMVFYMLNSNNIKDLPSPSGQNITFEKFNLDKCAVISFSWFVNERKIVKYKNKLQKFLDRNGHKAISPFMINRYDPPWTLPFMRRNEILVKID